MQHASSLFLIRKGITSPLGSCWLFVNYSFIDDVFWPSLQILKSEVHISQMNPKDQSTALTVTPARPFVGLAALRHTTRDSIQSYLCTVHYLVHPHVSMSVDFEDLKLCAGKESSFTTTPCNFDRYVSKNIGV